MTTYHVAKFDCFKSSRLNMQSKWDQKSVFVHVSTSDQENAYRLSVRQIAQLAKEAHMADRFVFHAQSSLPYLIISVLLGLVKRKQAVYDIHDLNVIPKELSYMKVRALTMYLLEYFTLKVFKISSITVSKGLAILMARRYKVTRPKVVRNISVDLPERVSAKITTEKKMVYFGTFDRLPNEFFDQLKREKLSIDIFGRFNNASPTPSMQNAIESGMVNYQGEYNPKAMDFLKDYSHLYYNIVPPDANYQFAGPNKFFQALTYGLTLLIPKGYRELTYLLDGIPGAFKVLEGNISELLASDFKQGEDYFSRVKTLLNLMKHDSKKNYLSVINS